MIKIFRDYKRFKEVANQVYNVAGVIAAYRYVINTANNKQNYIPSSVSSSFSWVNSPEGWDYWNTISEKLDK